MAYLSSYELETSPSLRRKRREKFSSWIQQILKGWNSFLVGYRIDIYLFDHQIKLSFWQTSSKLNGVFTSTGVNWMLKGRDFHVIDAGLWFVTAFIRRATVNWKESLLPALHVIYTNVIKWLLRSQSLLYYSNSQDLPIYENIRKLKAISMQLFGDLERVDRFTLKFYMLGHISEDFLRFRDMGLLNASPLSTSSTPPEHSLEWYPWGIVLL